MLFPEAAQYIRSNVPTADVLQLYGYTLNREGFMPCPFHSETKPSLKVYDAKENNRHTRRGWYCFGCHAGGSVLDFVMRHDSCSFADAVKAIDHHLNLGLLAVEDRQSQERYRSLQLLLDEAEQVLLAAADTKMDLIEREISYKFKVWRKIMNIPIKIRTAEEWTRLLSCREDLDYLEYRLAELERFRKEVHRWRNRWRMRNPENRDPGST